MREGWEVVKLGDVCQLLNGRAYKKPELLSEGKYPVLRVGNFFSNRNWYYSDLELDASKYCDDGDLLYAWSASFGPRIWSGGKVIYHYHIWKTELNEIRVNKKFLYYWFDWDAEKIQSEQGAGTTMVHVTKGAMEKRSLSLPPLAEQKRIVALLDQAFAGIELALAAASKNLKNARELFETTLNTTFTQKGEGWVDRKLEDFCDKITDGTHQTPKYSESGHIFLSSKNVKNGVLDWENVKYIDDAQHEEMQRRLSPKLNDILLRKNGAGFGKAAIVDRDVIFDVYVSLAVIRPIKDVIPQYLLLFLNSPAGMKQFQARIKGAGVPNLHLQEIRAVTVSFPLSQELQLSITAHMADLLTQTQRLEDLYQQKIDALNELKQSLLQKAFAGELTATDAIQAVEAKDTRSPEFAANVIAYAFRKHENDGKGKAFGRVKEQKFLHLTESVGDLNLGREPMKDVAGPNDFAHMLKAEEWAKSNQFFELVQDKDSKKYDFKKLANFDEMSAKAFAELKPYKTQLDKIADILVPMGWREAEVFATVHAAWNNLIINGDEITNDTIVFEARENWHAKKLEIPKQEFYDAIKLIRSKNLIPDGTAKRVGGQERLI